MGYWGVKVSKDGKDVSSTTPEDFVFNTKNDNNVKIVTRAGGTVIVNGSSYTDVTVTHNLGWIPMVMLFAETTPGSGNWFFGIQYSANESTRIVPDGTYTYVDANYFKFRVWNNTGTNKSVAYYYFIFGDPAS